MTAVCLQNWKSTNDNCICRREFKVCANIFTDIGQEYVLWSWATFKFPKLVASDFVHILFEREFCRKLRYTRYTRFLCVSFEKFPVGWKRTCAQLLLGASCRWSGDGTSNLHSVPLNLTDARSVAASCNYAVVSLGYTRLPSAVLPQEFRVRRRRWWLARRRCADVTTWRYA